MPKIFVIVVSYNGERWIRDCLGNLLESQIPVEVIVIDNNSTDRTVSIVENEFPKIDLIKQGANLGFGRANNIGIGRALDRHADYLFLLNQDAYVYPDTIGKLLSVHQNNGDYGIISPLQLNGSGTELDMLFKKFLSNSYPPEIAMGIENGRLEPAGLLPVRFINAASWFIARSCIDKVGLFDPLFYHYGEDNNYSSRTQYHGFKVGVTPMAAIRHDKVHDLSKNALLLRQIHLVPLCILLDLRKNIVTAFLLVFWKFLGYGWKAMSQRSPQIAMCTLKELKWMARNFSLVARSRKTSKIPYIRD